MCNICWGTLIPEPRGCTITEPRKLLVTWWNGFLALRRKSVFDVQVFGVIPEPSTLLLALVALGVVGGWRKWAG